jgi:hypothetical protein
MDLIYKFNLKHFWYDEYLEKYKVNNYSGLSKPVVLCLATDCISSHKIFI